MKYNLNALKKRDANKAINFLKQKLKGKRKIKFKINTTQFQINEIAN
jgi:hypothetical protein